MAIYEYACQACGKHFQVRRSMKDADAPMDCPSCGGKDTKRGLSLFFASSSGNGALKGGGSSCASCGGGSCASCGGH